MLYSFESPSGGMADAVDSKSTVGNYVGVQVPSRALKLRDKIKRFTLFGKSFAKTLTFFEFMREGKLGNRLPLFYIVTTLFWMALYAYVPFVTPYAEQMDTDLRLIGLIAGAYGFVQMALRFPLGILSDKLQKRKVFVLIGLFFAALSGFVVYFFPSPMTLLLSRSFAGVTAATWVTLTILGSSYYRPEDTIKSIGLLNAANGLGRMTVLLMGGFIAEWMGFSHAFLLAGGVGLVAFVLGFGIVETKPNVDDKKEPPSFSALLDVARNPQLLCASLLAILSQYIMFATTFGFTPMAAVQLGASNMQLGFLGMVSTLPALVISPFMSKIVQKSGLTFTLSFSFLLSGLGAALVATSSELWQLFLVQIVSSIGLAALITLLMGLSIRDISPERRATAMGFFQAVYGLGMFSGPFVTGLVWHSQGMEVAFMFTGIVGLMGMIVSIIFVRRGHLSASD